MSTNVAKVFGVCQWHLLGNLAEMAEERQASRPTCSSQTPWPGLQIPEDPAGPRMQAGTRSSDHRQEGTHGTWRAPFQTPVTPPGPPHLHTPLPSPCFPNPESCQQLRLWPLPWENVSFKGHCPKPSLRALIPPWPPPQPAIGTLHLQVPNLHVPLSDSSCINYLPESMPSLPAPPPCPGRQVRPALPTPALPGPHHLALRPCLFFAFLGAKPTAPYLLGGTQPDTNTRMYKHGSIIHFARVAKFL